MGIPTTQHRRARIRLARIALAVLAPLLTLGLLEGGLRLAGYGHPAAFFVSGPDGDLQANPRYGDLFFGPDLSRPPLPLRLDPRRPPGTLRVFVLGGSAVRGEPDPAFGPARLLEAMLATTFPARRVEVINTGMTAVNSHAVLPVARECARLDGDLAVVYLGNNEVVGPWGIGSTLGRPAPRWWIRLAIRVRATRLGQALGAVVRTVRGGSEDAAWGGMAMFSEQAVAADDPRLPGMRADLAANLADICAAFTDRGIPVLLATVAVNLRDQPPLLVLPDGEDAGALFAAGRDLLAAGDEAAGARALARARDLDGLRFRADGALNETIRRLATDRPGVHLVEAEGAFGPAPGAGLFHEHVHLTFAGSHRLAAVLFAAAAPLLGASPPPPVPALADCAAWLARTPYDEWHARRTILAITGRAPFGAAQARRDSALAEQAWGRMQAADPGRALQLSAAALARRPDDALLRARRAELLYFLGRDAAAITAWSRLLVRHPLAADWLVNRAQAEARSGDLGAAEADLRRALAIRPRHAAARVLLDQLAARRR